MHDAAARRKEMQWMQQAGIAGIKVDFFQSDKSFLMKEYLNILEDAAQHKLLVNFHGCTLPRGWAHVAQLIEHGSGERCRNVQVW